MKRLIVKLAHALNAAGYRPVDLIVWAVLLAYATFVVRFLSQPVDLLHGAIIAALSYYLIRIFYEFTFNRGRIPTYSTGFFETQKIVRLLKKDWKDKSRLSYRIVDFGCGNGQLTRTLARAIPAAQVVGIENTFLPFQQCVFLKKLFGFKNLGYLRMDFFHYDCAEVDVAIAFLNGRVTALLGEKLYKELKPGSLVIANEFELKGLWHAPEVVTFRTPFKATLYVYRKP